MATDDELQAAFDAMSADQGAINKLLGQATERMGVHDYREAQINISAADARNSKSGLTLDALHDLVLPPTGTPPPFTYPEPTQVILVPMQWGESIRGYQADSTKITGMQFVAQKNGSVSLGVAEYGSPPTYRQSAFTPDFTGPTFSGGNQTYSSITVAAGQTYTLYFRAWNNDIGPTAPQPVEGVAVEGGWA